MKISEVSPNYRRRCFVIRTPKGEYTFPFAKFSPAPSTANRVKEVFPDDEMGREGFTYQLESGAEDSVHLDVVLEYHRDPEYMHEILLYRLTVEAIEAVKESRLSKRELIRRLKTSPSQFYRLLDTTYYGKSLGQMIALLHLVDKEVELVVRGRTDRPAGISPSPRSVA